MKRKDKIAVSVIAVFAVGVLVYLVAPGVLGSKHQTTNDAFVAADFTLVAPRVAGFIKEVLVEDNQRVKAGQLLALIDDRDFRAAAQAAVERLECGVDAQTTGQATDQRSDDQRDHHMHARQAEDQHDADGCYDCIHFTTSKNTAVDNRPPDRMSPPELLGGAIRVLLKGRALCPKQP